MGGTDGKGFEFLAVERRGPVGWLLYGRPPRNAWHWEMLSEHLRALTEVSADETVRVIVLASALPRYFSVGADLHLFEDISAARMGEWVDLCHACARLIRDAPKPVLAAIGGTAVGGGLEFTYHADLRFAAADARLGQPEIGIGFIPPCGATVALARLVGRPRALRYLYDGALLDAAAAAAIGLVDEVVEPARLHETVQAYALALAAKPASGLAAIRRTVTEAERLAFDAAMALEREQAMALAGTEGFRSGVARFLRPSGSSSA
jgi:enoyl-CoA hydratase/carnithine racemase